MRRTGAVLALVVGLASGLLLGGCGADSEEIDPSGVDGLVIPTPSPDPDDFVRHVDNPYFPLEQGSTWVYEDTAARSTTTVTVEPSNLVVAGVPVTVVRSLTEGPLAPVETVDYYAQDRDGNVWWFGRQGVWDAEGPGEAGLAMPATPRVGDGWRRGYQEGVVEDRLTVLSVDDGTVVLRLESDLDPGAVTRLTYSRTFGLTASAGPEGSTELSSGP